DRARRRPAEGKMKRWWMVLSTVLLCAATTACGGGEEVRSGSGPEVNPTPDTDAEADDTTEEESEPTSTTTSTAPPAAEPSTSPMLAVSGTVTVADGTAGELSVVAVGSGQRDYGATVPVIVRNRTTKTLYS